jgi:two-component system sensor histidine kinase/response regulator
VSSSAAAPAAYRIVIVDDVPEIREILTFLLEETGWFDVVGHAANGVEAVDVVERHKPDLVLLDLDLAGMSGWDVLAELRPRVPDTKVVILTSLEQRTPAAAEVRDMADAVLEKGIANTELTARLLDVLGSTRPMPFGHRAEATLARAIAQLERKNRELARSNEELDSFAAVASHDLAQPLQVAYGYMSMLQTDYADQLDDNGKAWLGNAMDSLERMRTLVRHILHYARAGSGEPRLRPVELGAVVGEALDAVSVLADERDATVTVDDDLPTVLADPMQLALVFQNVIANAMKYVPDGTRPAVHVSTDGTAGGSVVVEVADNGVGIPEAQRAAVFGMFQRVAGRSELGTGLGLATVKKIVGRHGGDVWVEDGPGGVGTKMCIRLPTP